MRFQVLVCAAIDKLRLEECDGLEGHAKVHQEIEVLEAGRVQAVDDEVHLVEECAGGGELLLDQGFILL